MQEKNAHLQGQLLEKQSAMEMTSKELDAARLQRFAADKAKIRAEADIKWTENKCIDAYDQMDNLRKEAAEATKQLNESKVCEQL